LKPFIKNNEGFFVVLKKKCTFADVYRLKSDKHIILVIKR
jgi:hypothetical protein